jgi:NDP-sugar pyrophosphorylase family protein
MGTLAEQISMTSMKAVILAGGLGTRLQPFTQVIPKPLLPIGESSVLEIQILSLAGCGFKDIFVATNYMSEYIEAFLGNGTKYGVNLTFSRESKPLGTVGPVLLLREQLTDPFVLMNGDILTTLNFRLLLERGAAADADLTVVTKEIITPFNFGKVTSDGPHILAIEEKPDMRIEVLAGIYVLKPAVLDLIPSGEYYGIDLMIKSMLAQHRTVGRYAMTEYWLDIGQAEHYRAAQSAYDEHFEHLKKSS